MIETANLILRRPVASDWESYRAFTMSPRSATLGGPYSLGRAWRNFAAEFGHWDIRGFGMFAVTRKGSDEALAMIGPWYPGDWPETEVGWMVLSDKAEGKGLAFEAADAAIDHAYKVLGWDTVVSYVAPGNTRSARLAERLGAVVDPSAPQPKPEEPCLVYRHPRRAA
jgi:RimJ/RimL family protein N-acetyltransferase